MEKPENLLAAGTVLARLDRVPPFAERLWEATHHLEGGAVRVPSAVFDPAGRMLERLGLALAAREELAGAEPDSIRMRLIVVALLEQLGGVTVAAAELLTRFFKLSPQAMRAGLASPTALAALAALDPQGATDLARLKAQILRLETMAREAADPRRLRLRASATPPPPTLPAETVVVTEEGVSVKPGPVRRWRKVPELTTELCADAARIAEAAALSVVRGIADGRTVELDMILEP